MIVCINQFQKYSYNISSASWTNRTSTVNGSSILPTFSPNGRYGHSSIAYGSHIFIVSFVIKFLKLWLRS